MILCISQIFSDRNVKTCLFSFSSINTCLSTRSLEVHAVFARTFFRIIEFFSSQCCWLWNALTKCFGSHWWQRAFPKFTLDLGSCYIVNMTSVHLVIVQRFLYLSHFLLNFWMERGWVYIVLAFKNKITYLL